MLPFRLPRLPLTGSVLSGLSVGLVIGGAVPKAEPAPPAALVSVFEQTARQYHAPLRPLKPLPPTQGYPLPYSLHWDDKAIKPLRIWKGELLTKPLTQRIYVLEFQDSAAANHFYRLLLPPPPRPAGSFNPERDDDAFYWSTRNIAHRQWVIQLEQNIMGRDNQFSYGNLSAGNPQNFYTISSSNLSC